MRSSLVLPAALLITVIGAGCGDPTLDGSTEETLKKSVEEVGKSLDDAKREKFEAAYLALGLDVLHTPGVFGDEEAMRKKMKETFDGKTADEIIADAEKVRAANEREMQDLLK